MLQQYSGTPFMPHSLITFSCWTHTSRVRRCSVVPFTARRGTNRQ